MNKTWCSAWVSLIIYTVTCSPAQSEINVAARKYRRCLAARRHDFYTRVSRLRPHDIALKINSIRRPLKYSRSGGEFSIFVSVHGVGRSNQLRREDSNAVDSRLSTFFVSEIQDSELDFSESIGFVSRLLSFFYLGKLDQGLLNSSEF